VTAEHNGWGIGLDARSTTTSAPLDVTVVNSVAAHNVNQGYFSGSGSGHPTASLVLRNVSASHNSEGVYAFGTGAIVRLAHSVVAGNTNKATDVYGGGVIYSYGDNEIDVTASGLTAATLQ
jgi:hypothetical protein